MEIDDNKWDYLLPPLDESKEVPAWWVAKKEVAATKQKKQKKQMKRQTARK